MSSTSSESRRPSPEPVDDLREIHDHLLNHIILPRFLPDKLPEMDDNHESYLMNKFLETIKDCAEWIPDRTTEAMKAFKKTHDNRTGESISEQIKKLEPGHTFSMLIKNQKCVFMIHVPYDDINENETNVVQIATFPSCVIPNEMYKSNFHLTYPAQTLTVKFSDLLCSKEFADQLCRLYGALKPPTKRSRVSYPNEVSTWLMASLCQWNYRSTAKIDMPTVTKKIRDEAIGKKDKKRPLEYWQRSQLYMAMKVVLQLNITIQMGHDRADEAKLMYKLVMLRFLTQMCAEYVDPLFSPQLNIDKMTEVIAKMARRIEKLSTLVVQVDMDKFIDDVIDAAKFTIGKVRERINGQIRQLENDFNRKNVLEPLKDLNFEADLDQQIPKLCAYLNDRKSSRNGDDDDIIHTSNRVPEFMREKLTPELPPTLDLFEKCRGQEEKYINMTETEFWYLYVLELTDDRWSCADLMKRYKKYSKLSDKFHIGDPLAMTRMLLIRLKLLAVLDRKATIKYRMLLEHGSGVNTGIFDHFLLPHSIDMKIAYDLQTYFSERNQNALYPSLIGEQSISSNSFSVRFCIDNGDFTTEIENIRRAIQVADEEKIKQLKMEWTKQRDEARILRLSVSAATCTQESIVMSAAAMQKHRTNCNKCLFNHKIESLMIKQYKPTLPESIEQQNAILFELIIPDEIAILRDVLQKTNAFHQNSTTKLDIKENWSSRELLKTFNKSKSENVFLSSTGSVEPIEYPIGEHDDFIKLLAKNESNCIFHDGGMELNSLVREDVFKELFTLVLEPDSPYARLQWTMKSHSQNEVLSRQAECHKNLTLSEFKEFGSLRADGHRLQLRKLYAIIETDAMSFDQPSVCKLILQTIWQMGPTSENSYVRESHEDFVNVDFATAMIESLHKFVQKHKQNWAHPNKLLVVVFIAVRIFELNENVSVLNRVMVLLHEIRAILADWLGKIQNLLNTTIERNQDSEKSLRHSLATVSIALAVTFFVNRNHPFYAKIFEKNPNNGFTAPRMWLLAIIKLYNNALINNNNNQKNANQTNLQMLIRIVRNTGIQCEPMIRQLITDSPTDIIEVIKQQWSHADEGKCTFEFSKSCSQSLEFAFEFKDRVDKVSIDIVTGAFLVNYLSVDQLPQRILSDPMHQRVFGEYAFEVQPRQSNYFSTVQKFNGCHYDFSWWKDSAITIEHRFDNDTFELIPIRLLTEDIPIFLIENHSHWWHKQKNIIEFRPQQWNHKNFTKECGIEYTLDLNTNRLTQMKTNRPLLSIHSASYRIILGYLSRLEDPKYINVFLSSQNVHEKAIIELVRMNLKFIIDTTMANEDGTFEMDSNEFSEMFVSRRQNCQTLYGLNHGLLLESTQHENKKVLILPHGKKKSVFTYAHISVDIDLRSELRSPPFHRYEVDTVLHQLKPSNSNFSAWFYLAYLHAITSHGEIEPLTGMSGTERALQILQSSYVWSSAPYDNEVFHTLQLIANLTPHRSLIDNKIQKIEWPKDILEHCAQDSYYFIVEKLVKDSQRLSELHFRKDKFELKKMSNSNLNRRDYFRCLPLRPNLRVDDTFMGHEMVSKPLSSPSINYSKPLKMVTTLFHANSFKIQKNFKLKEFLTNTSNLCGPKYLDYVSKYLSNNAKIRFVDLWISFYEIARLERLSSNHFALILSRLIHEGDKSIINLIMILQAIDNNPVPFRNIKPPKTQEYPAPNDLFNIEEVAEILNSCCKNPIKYKNKAWTKYIENRIMHETKQLKDFVHDKWPCNKIDFGTIKVFEYIAIEDATAKLNERLSTWYKNRCLHQFIDAVADQLKRLIPINKIKETDLCVVPKPLTGQQPQPKYQINFAERMIRRLTVCPELEEAKMVWNMEMISDRSTAEWKNIYENAVRSVDDKHLVDAGLFPRLVPTMILPQIANEQTHPDLKAIIGSYALAIAHAQHTERIEDCEHQPDPEPNPDEDNIEDGDSANGSQEDMDHSAMDHELQPNVSQSGHELVNMAHVNWKPCEYPEWLLFEIERNLTIRRIQIEVAKRMINPPDIGTKHSVMQLNMGEGKTAVIVPILASVLANGEQACQIIVLKSLFATNLNSLRQYLGGMLNRRIYIFPCRRDMPITDCVTKLLPIYEECKRMKGVILTLPEYLLSFQLKIYESVQKENLAAAGTFLAVHKWMNANIRNIMDESDAILQAKYQLIYTVGNQLALDGGINRWVVTQAVLKRVPHHMKSLFDKYDGRKIEYDASYMQINGQVGKGSQVLHRTDVFTPCRILDETVYEELSQLLIDDFVKGLLEITFPEMNAAAKNIVRLFLLEKNNNSELLNGIKGEFTSVHMDILMILNGLLRFNLLKLILTRRWRVSYGVKERVNYGVNEKGARQMAIPFKAKDVATEMTEFGHPDVAIGFTQLSYYYSGLSDEQLYRVFEILNPNPNATVIYDKLISSIPSKLIEESGIKCYSNVNLEDPVQRNEQLFPLLRYNMNVIDFWLSIDVYPREAKTFERKLKCTAWDLCSEHLQHRVTGFSGTNDTKNILPLPVAQNDLQELEQTNERVRKILLKRENENYVHLPPNVSGIAIIRKLVEYGYQVLLDAGALMLEFSNEQMAREWLNCAPDINEAVVYFDSNDVLQTFDRNGTVVEFDCSVYRDDLSKCLVYIDDIHTRGTDLKFPLEWTACVTLSGDITRDKTVQACMRMRHLDKDHFISFWASHEADIRIKKICKLKSDGSVLNKHIIEFISKNSQCFEMENTVHWATAAYNYTKKLAGHKLYEDHPDEAVSLTNLYKSSVDNELATLENLYGNKDQIKLNELVAQKFDELMQTFEPHKQIAEFIQTNKNDILIKMNSKNIPCSWQSLDEEQEKELERQFEVHRYVERPTLMRPKKPNFDASLVNYFLNGPDAANDSLVHISSGLKNTSFFEPYKNEIDAWSPNLFVTKDFQNVLNTDTDSTESCDDFLRPVWWICGVRVDNGIQWIILSSFECDCLMPTFRKSKIATLFMYRPRISRFQDNFLHNDRLKVSGMVKPLSMDMQTEIEIGVYGGSMYFRTDAEQQAFCGFLGLIPRPRTNELEEAFKRGIIKPNGFVPAADRNLDLVKNYVGNCKFDQNPAGLAIKLIVAHRQFMRKESHVASIVDRGIKLQVENAQDDVMDWQEIAQKQQSGKRPARRKRQNSKRPKLS